MSTLTSTLSPGPKPRLLLFFALESFASVMFLIGINPDLPTPISTKAPKRVAFSTFPVRTAPTLKSSRQTMLLLKSGLSKSKVEREKNQVFEIGHQQDNNTVKLLTSSKKLPIVRNYQVSNTVSLSF